MTSLQTTAIAPLLIPLLSGLFALLGVVAGGIIQFLLAERGARRLRNERREDDDAQKSERLQATAVARAFPAMIVARHLEGYALDCAKTVSANQDRYLTKYEAFPSFSPWPEVNWELLGADASVRARDFETKVSLHNEQVIGAIETGAQDEDDAAEYYSEASARAGWEAWQIAKAIREGAGLPIFALDPSCWDYPKTLKNLLDVKEEERRERSANRNTLEAW